MTAFCCSSCACIRRSSSAAFAASRLGHAALDIGGGENAGAGRLRRAASFGHDLPLPQIVNVAASARAWRAIIRFSSVLMTKAATRLPGVLMRSR